MLKLRDITKRVQFKCDDPDGTYIDEDYVMGFANDVYDWMFNKLSLSGAQFSEEAVVLPDVTAGSPDLSKYQQEGQPLAGLIVPIMLRWRLPGQDNTQWRRVDGPLDAPRDLPASGLPSLETWAWVKYNILLSATSLAVDIEVTGSFAFAPLTDMNSAIQISMNANRVFSCKLASEVCKARNKPTLVQTYENDADDAMDDVMILLTRARQPTIHRVGRMSRSSGSSSRISITH